MNFNQKLNLEAFDSFQKASKAKIQKKTSFDDRKFAINSGKIIFIF